MLKAISGNVFIQRDEHKSNYKGIEISGKAQVKPMTGTISSVDGECQFAKSGDQVHIPHYGVEDIEHEGREYATCKTDRLFLVNGKPVNGYVRVRKCENDHVRDDSGEIALYMTNQHIEHTTWVEVMDVADSCKNIKSDYVGLFCPSPERDERLARIGRTKDYCLHEELIEFLTDGE